MSKKKTTGERRRRLRIKLFNNNPYCYYCGRITHLLQNYPADGKLHNYPRAATIEHLYSKLNPNRDELKHLDIFDRLKIACYKCNQKKSRQDQAAFLQEHKRRSILGSQLSQLSKKTITNKIKPMNNTMSQSRFELPNWLNPVKDAIKNIWTNMGQSVRVNTQHTFKSPTFCCALFHLAAEDHATIDEIKYQIDRARIESKLSWNIKTRASGERGCFVIVCPHENNLRENLKKLNFVNVWKFPRRNGYPSGLLEMWVLSW